MDLIEAATTQSAAGRRARKLGTSPHCVVIGGGILRLAVADRVVRKRPGARVTVLEKARPLGRAPDRTQQRGAAFGAVSHPTLLRFGPVDAVLAFAREGYKWRTIWVRELAGTLSYPGFWRMASKHARIGSPTLPAQCPDIDSRNVCARAGPEIADDDLTRAPAGVRAQAVLRDGSLVDDFLVERQGRTVHVLNAPSPPATSTL